MLHPLSTVASFLNLDLELEAAVELTPIVEYLGKKVFVLYCGEVDGGFRLSVEPLIDGALSKDPSACTEYFLRLLEAFSEDHGELWRSCRARTFDYGFDGGLEQNPFHTNICAAHLARMAKLDIDLRVTVYPFRGIESPGQTDASANADFCN